MPSPFEKVFDPSGEPSVLGLIGKAFGVQTAEERKSQAESQILSELGKYHEETGDPQRSILKLLQSPRGIDLLSNPGAVGILDTFKKSVTPPAPTVMAPGSQAIGPDGKTVANNPTEGAQNMNAGVPAFHDTSAGGKSTVYTRGQPSNTITQPTEGVQNFEGGVPQIASTGAGGRTSVIQSGKVTDTITQPTEADQTFAGMAAKVDPSIIPKLAELRVAGTPEQQKALEIDRLVKSGKLSPEVASGIMAGTLQIIDEMNENGEKTGRHLLFDLTKGGSVPITGVPTTGNTGPGAAPASAAPPEQIKPHAVNPDGSINPATAFPPNEQMFFKSGALPMITKYAGRMVRALNPSNKEGTPLEVEQGDAHRQLLRKSLIDLGSSGNGRLKTKVESWLPLIPGEGYTEDPKAALVNGRALLGDLRGQKVQEDAIANNLMRSHKERTEARENSIRLQQAIDLMPTHQRMAAMEKQIDTGTAPVVNPGEAVRTTGNLAVEAAKGVAGTAKAVKTEVTGEKPATPAEQKIMQQLPTMGAVEINKLDAKTMSPAMRNAVYKRILEIKASMRKPEAK